MITPLGPGKVIKFSCYPLQAFVGEHKVAVESLHGYWLIVIYGEPFANLVK
jgi:hypothetical protein